VSTAAPLSPPPAFARLATDRRRAPPAALGVPRVDGAVRGAVAVRPTATSARRAEAGPAGPVVLRASGQPGAAAVVLEVWGPAATPPETVEAALAAAGAWLGLDDDPSELAAVAARHPVTRAIHSHTGDVRLSRLPTVREAFGRAVLHQLVQTAEARRSCAQLAARHGTATPAGVWAWPTPNQLGATPAWTLRRCGISLRGATALHAGAVADGRLTQVVPPPGARDGWDVLDRRLRGLPGVGVWTSAKTRAALGDPDAVAVGDYNLPAFVCTVLHGHAHGDGPDGRWTDAAMLAALQPFAGERGRIIRLLQAGAARGIVAGPTRRAPRAARSAHRYW
jgi:3-methyladenine DNA glycosylase/8-oxoguanine DNA glycosylase